MKTILQEPHRAALAVTALATMSYVASASADDICVVRRFDRLRPRTKVQAAISDAGNERQTATVLCHLGML